MVGDEAEVELAWPWSLVKTTNCERPGWARFTVEHHVVGPTRLRGAEVASFATEAEARHDFQGRSPAIRFPAPAPTRHCASTVIDPEFDPAGADLVDL
jgi:hypothetical protein